MTTLTIAIPTRNRSQYLFYALSLCAEVKSRQVEFLVLNNASSDDTVHTFLKFQNDRRFILRSFEESVSINKQFERALEHCAGDWILVIGDDDGVVPPMIDYLVNFLETEHGKSQRLVYWPHVIYRWKNDSNPESNFLRIFECVPGEPGLIQENLNIKSYLSFSNDEVLSKIYSAPGIYHSAVHVSYARALQRDAHTSIFWGSPDVSFRVHCCLTNHSAIRVMMPCSISGYSKKSTGISVTDGGLKSQFATFKSENPELLSAIRYRFKKYIPESIEIPLTENLGTFEIICHALEGAGLNAPSLSVYVRSELSGALKSSAESRPKIKCFLEQLSKSSNVAISDEMLEIFDSRIASASLGNPRLNILGSVSVGGMQRTVISGAWPLNDTYVSNISDAVHFFCNLTMLR